MSIELGVWRIDQQVQTIQHAPMDNEKRLEELLEAQISIVAPHLMVIGRQVLTSFGKYIDLLAIDGSGNLAVLELKRDQTPRDVVAQALDYGSWVHQLQADDIQSIWVDYVSRFKPAFKGQSLDAAFCARFALKAMPEDLNSEHELIVVASSLDDSTERIVNYLADYHGVNINAVLFRMFKDGDREYLTRVWLRDPTGVADPVVESSKNAWNGEYYVSFGAGRDWAEAVKYGFVSGGGGTWYSNTLGMLSPGDRIWVKSPGDGYLGVGIVEEPKQPIDTFMVLNDQGESVPILSLPLTVAQRTTQAANPTDAEYMVRVKWLKTVAVAQAIQERGMFGNQNTVARPKTPQWAHTVQRLKEAFGIEE